MSDIQKMSKQQKNSGGDLSLAEIIRRSQTDFELDFYGRIAAQSPHYADVLAQLAQIYTLKGWHRAALEIDRRLSRLKPREPQVAYNLACSYCLLGRTDEALGALRRALSLGFWDIDQMLSDPDLSRLHDAPEFQDLLQTLDFEIHEN